MPTDPLIRSFAALVADARDRATATGRPVLVSASEEIPSRDPLTALEAAEAVGGADAELAELVQAGRMVWAHPRADLTLAGFGAAATIAPSGVDRFAQADAAWRALLADALTDDANASAPATGPLLTGGFSFAVEGPHSPAWQGFPSTHLIVPALRVTSTAGATVLTLSTLVQRDGTSSVSVDALARLRMALLAAPARLTVDAGDGGGRLRFASVRPTADWRAVVREAVAEIGRGAMDKVVLARAVRAATPNAVGIPALLDHLRATYHNAYVFAYWRGERAFVGASPERLVSLTGGVVDASSLAGSARRGATVKEDAALAAGLMSSGKDRAEHALVRGALRTALGQFCDDVTSRDEPSLLTLPNVHHLYTAVRGRLRAGHSLLELAGVLHPTPAVGGDPREPALRFIREHEQLDRGWYAGPIGWIGREDGELAVALRSALVGESEAILFAGCGIVAGSDPDRELAESEVKLRAMESALAAVAGEAPTEPVARVPAHHARR